ncbi:hypothetical protein CTAYLR_007455 [Chrysophaeum taylorii]|uniref:U2 snRNP-associated SURP motif-containing protein n=1 Tax=Chrysophaeum taylorii TaxID=2483200 RepID=A0AAD7XJH1_9STRA|nr:hypothetical protein CTAYLR_007455 [Chrysophaeum taylorii]
MFRISSKSTKRLEKKTTTTTKTAALRGFVQETTRGVASQSQQGKKRRAIDEFLEEIKSRETMRGLAGAAEAVPVAVADTTSNYESTNLYVGNLATTVTEEKLRRSFGLFGQIYSVKIMWPRSDDERRRGRNKGFVSFVRRDDAEDARGAMDDAPIDGVAWGKPLKDQPPPRFSDIAAQTAAQRGGGFAEAAARVEEDEAPTIAVVAPRDADRLICRVAQYVAADGRAFEVALLAREKGNPAFGFATDASDDAVFYRWKVYECLNRIAGRGPPPRLRMQSGGPIWMAPDDDDDDDDYAVDDDAGDLYDRRGARTGDATVDDQHLESLLGNLSPTRNSVREAMVYALERADAARQISAKISDFLLRDDEEAVSLLARLYLVSDVLHNSGAPSRGARLYRALLRPVLPKAAGVLGARLRRHPGRPRIVADVAAVFATWLRWSHVFAPMVVYGVELSFFLKLLGAEDLDSPYDPTRAAAENDDDDDLAALRRDARLTGLDDAGARQHLAARLALLRRYVKHRMLGTEPALSLEAATAETGSPNDVVPSKRKRIDVPCGDEL